MDELLFTEEKPLMYKELYCFATRSIAVSTEKFVHQFLKIFW